MLLNKKGQKGTFIKILAIVISAVLFNTGWFISDEKIVNLTINGETETVLTSSDRVGEFLKEQNVKVGPEDLINRGFDYEFNNLEQNYLKIKKAKEVTVECDGQTISVLTHKDTIFDVLNGLDITLSEDDRIVGMRGDTKIVDGMNIEILRVLKQESTEMEYKPNKVKLVANDNMLASERKVVQPGRKGILESKYKIVLENGEITSKKLISQREVQSPVTQIEQYGTLHEYKLNSGEKFVYSKVYDMKATAYTTSYEECKKTEDHPAYGITYTGVPVKKGIIAVDPKVIPLGTSVYIETVGPGNDYGFSLAADIGSGVDGHKVDLYMDDLDKAIKWGVRNVRVYIIKETK